jgi:hypothetical protein
VRSRRSPRGERRDSTPSIKVSEIAEYGYCSRAWWYKHVVKLPEPEGSAPRLAAGTRAHRQHGMWVAGATRLGLLGMGLALCGLAVLGLALWK